MKMKKNTKLQIKLAVFLSVLLIALVGSGCLGQNSDNQIVATGSTTVLPLMQDLSEKYMENHNDVIISVSGGGSGVGIAEFIDGTNDIAMSSRKIKDSEVEAAIAKNRPSAEHTIAYDGITIIVHPSNNVSSLTMEQLQKIYSGEIKNWKDVGGPDKEIAVIARDSASGTQEFFTEAVMGSVPYRNDMITQSATGAVTNEVAQNEKAIGIIGAAYQVNSVKTIAINVNGTNIMPTEQNILSGTYPISRALYLYTDKTPTTAVSEFIAYILSPSGQKVVKDLGYAPV